MITCSLGLLFFTLCFPRTLLSTGSKQGEEDILGRVIAGELVEVRSQSELHLFTSDMLMATLQGHFVDNVVQPEGIGFGGKLGPVVAV